MTDEQILEGQQKRGRMEVIIYVLGAISALLAIFIGFFLYYHKQNLAIWATFLAIVITALACCLQWQSWVWKQTELSNKQTSENKPVLEMPTFTEDIKECVFDFGTNIAIIPIEALEKQPLQPYQLGIAPELYIKNHKLYVDVVVSDPDKSLPVQLKEGKLTVTPLKWDTNSNESAFEVVDEKLDVVFQIIYSKPSKVFLYGVFPDPTVEGHLLYVSNNGIQGAFSKPDGFYIKRHFKYPSWKYPGQFDE